MTPARSHRSLFLLAASLGIQVLLLAAQIKRDQDVRLIRVWAVEIVAPLGRSVTWLAGGIRNSWTNYIGVRSLGRENQQLRAEVDQLRLRNAGLEGRAAEAERLAKLFDFRQRNAEVPMLAARVIGTSPSISGRMVFLDRGSHDGVSRDMGVITPEGVVGKIIAAYPATSQVLLVNDKESGVGALLVKTRAQSPVRGSGNPELTMEYVAKDVKVTPGEAIVTSGQDQIFPKDLPVGVVDSVTPDPRGPFQRIVVKPAARLDRLEEVLVLLTQHEFASGGFPPIVSEGAGVEETSAAPPTPPAPPSARTTTTNVSAPARPPTSAQTRVVPPPAVPQPPTAAPNRSQAPRSPGTTPAEPTVPVAESAEETVAPEPVAAPEQPASPDPPASEAEVPSNPEPPETTSPAPPVPEPTPELPPPGGEI